MFGTIKENILSKLETIYNNEGEKGFKIAFNKYVKTIKENKHLKEFYEVYDLFKEVNFDNYETAKDFIEESINHLKKYDKNQLNKLLGLVDDIKPITEDSIEHKLDQLIFNENLNLKNKFDYKTKLINQITKNNQKNVDYKDTFEKLNNKIEENVSKLSEEETELLNLFIENDNEKIKNYYKTLINETEEIVENKILEADNHDVTKRLIEVKRKLNTLKNQEPNINEIEDITDLKKSLI